MPLIGDRRGETDPEAITEPAPATMRDRLAKALEAWWEESGDVEVCQCDGSGTARFLDFVAKRLEGEP